jgi:2-oxoglutarate dehydrogenase complex dehydrogenase (E1) component-like enzyme
MLPLVADSMTLRSPLPSEKDLDRQTVKRRVCYLGKEPHMYTDIVYICKYCSKIGCENCILTDNWKQRYIDNNYECKQCWTKLSSQQTK